MKNLLFFVFAFSLTIAFGQTKSSYLQTDYFYGNLIQQNPDASILLQGHPTGMFFSYNIRTNGSQEWHSAYNYPDYGISMGYQDYKSEIAGKLFAIYGHYNFYFTNRNSLNQVILRAGIGLAYNTNPYDKVTNNKNTAFGTHLNSSTYFKLYFQRENLIQNLGLNAGLTFIHASNSNIKSPNSGANVWAATLGVNYNLEKDKANFSENRLGNSFTEPIKYNFAIRGGINESEIIGSGVKPFFVATAYADKRVSRKSALQLGVDFYVSPILKEYYELNEIIPHTNLKEADDFTRLGLFIGHELFINKLSIEATVGYYVKYPYEYDGRLYETLGLKRYINDKWFASVRLKAHAANAETVEFGVGIRL